MYEKITYESTGADEDRFVIGEKCLGVGGMGKVHLGFDMKQFEHRAFK